MTSTYDASEPLRPGMPLVGLDTAEIAHVLMPLAFDVERFGISRCGYPAEYLTIVPEIGWSDVKPDRQCPHCLSDEPHAPSPDVRTTSS